LDKRAEPIGARRKKQRTSTGELNLQSVTRFLDWLQAFTTIEVVHVFAVSLVIATIAIVDLRLLGLASTRRSFTELAKQVLPVTWLAFGVAAVAGSLLFISQATGYFASTVFWIKMAIVVLAGINMLIFELITVRGVREWDVKPTPPLPAKLAGGISLTCWVLIVVFGRWTGFTMLPE
jgi:hypothetical protein